MLLVAGLSPRSRNRGKLGLGWDAWRSGPLTGRLRRTLAAWRAPAALWLLQPERCRHSAHVTVTAPEIGMRGLQLSPGNCSLPVHCPWNGNMRGGIAWAPETAVGGCFQLGHQGD